MAEIVVHFEVGNRKLQAIPSADVKGVFRFANEKDKKTFIEAFEVTPEDRPFLPDEATFKDAAGNTVTDEAVMSARIGVCYWVKSVLVCW